MKKLICGIDEAGRGPLAGSVTAAAVILGGFSCDLLNDSKKLTEAKRDLLEKQIKDNALAYGIGWATHEEIDKINILQAALLAMKRAYNEMILYAAKKGIQILNTDITAIIDGNKTPDLPCSCKAIIKADAQVPEVMAASILAKTARDNYMNEIAKLYPEYGYEKHKGYPTKAHREAIKKHGASPIQRLTFSVS